MFRSCYKGLGKCLGLSSSDGLLWYSDLKQHASGEFSIAVVQANSTLEDQSQVITTPNTTYVGIFDGHGGPEASRFVNKYLFSFLHEFESEQKGLSADVLKKAFSATEEEFHQLVRREFRVRTQMASVGSCCLVGAVSNNELYVANLGDSRVVLGRRISNGRNESVIAERLSNDHNVADEEVRKEVEALHPGPIVVNCRGVWRINGIIQVSRSIGDVYLKKPEFSKDPIFQLVKAPVLSAEPAIISRKLEPQDLFLIFASDGLWEQLSDEAAVDIVVKNPRAGIAKRLVTTAIQEVAKKLDMKYSDIKNKPKGNRRSYHDDITVIVIYLDQNAPGSPNRKYKHANGGCITPPVDIFSHKTGDVVDGLIF